MTWLPPSLALALHEFGPRKRGLRYPQPLREQILSAVRDAIDAGASPHEISTALGIRWSTLQRWMPADAPLAPQSAPRFVPIHETADAAHDATPLRLRSPGGWILEGLSLAQALALIQRLS